MDWRWNGSSWARLWWQPLSSGYLICTSSLDKLIYTSWASRAGYNPVRESNECHIPTFRYVLLLL